MTTTVDRVQGRIPVTVLRIEGDLDASDYRRSSMKDGACTQSDRDLLIDLGTCRSWAVLGSSPCSVAPDSTAASRPTLIGLGPISR